METLQIDGITYQKVSSAARDTGYTSDYVGQLCRAGKINAKLVGRTWYVEKDAIGGHKREKVRSNSSQTRKSIASELKVQSETNRTTSVAMHPLFASKSRERLLTEEVRYEKDENNLIPIVRNEIAHETSHQIQVLKSIEVLSEEEMPEEVPETPKTEVKWNGTIVVAPVEDVEEPAVDDEAAVVTEAQGKSFSALADDVFQPSESHTEKHSHRSVEKKTSSDFLTKEEQEDMLGISHQVSSEAVVVHVSRLPMLFATVLTCAFLVTATFLEGVWVYQSGTQNSQPYMTTAYNVASVSNIASLINN